MKRRMSMILVAFSTTIVFTIDRNVNAEESRAFAEAAKTTPVLVLDGSPHNRGLQHGQALKKSDSSDRSPLEGAVK